jgi:lysine-N-methylase
MAASSALPVLSPDGVLGARYVERFACVGSACEDHCCHGWQVEIDEVHYRSLKKAMEGSREERARFRDSHRRLDDAERTPSRHALVVLRDDASCSMLDADRLCSTQRRYGAEQLSNTCAMYPREPVTVGARTEMHAVLSCPEVARQLLLHDDALDPVTMPPAAMARPMIMSSLPDQGATHYDRAFDDVRDALWRLLGTPYPLAARLSFLALFSDATRPWLRQGGGEPHQAHLASLRGAFDGPALAPLYAELAAVGEADAIGFQVVVRLLMRRFDGGFRTPFHRLVARALQGHGDAQATLDRYRAERAAWRGQLDARIDGYFLSYARHYLAKNWYVKAPDLFAYIVGLLVRVVTLRFVFHLHPAVRAAAAAGVTRAEQERALDAAAVETVYSFTRAVEHEPKFREALESVAADSVPSAAHAVMLARF